MNYGNRKLLYPYLGLAIGLSLSTTKDAVRALPI
jgi:hypothetical protein